MQWWFLWLCRAKHELFTNLFGENLLILAKCRHFAWKSCVTLMTTKFPSHYPMVGVGCLYVCMCLCVVPGVVVWKWSFPSILNGSTDGYKHAVAVCRICDKNIVYFILLQLQFGEIATKHTHTQSDTFIQWDRESHSLNTHVYQEPSIKTDTR